MRTFLPFDAFDLSEDEAHNRFDRAVRNGHRHWLWPDTPIEAWQAALAQFESVAREILTVGRACQPLRGRPEDIGIAGYTSGMGPLLGTWLSQGLIDAPDGVAAVLELHRRHNGFRMEAMARHAIAVVDALGRCGIEVVVLKGMDTAWSIFPDPASRPLSDIDLLIDPADEPAAGNVLREMNYVSGLVSHYPPACSWRMVGTPEVPRTLAFVHRNDPWSIDLQTSLNRRYSYGAPVIRLDRIKSAAVLEPWSLSSNAWTLAREARAVHLATHASCGLASLSLLRLVELVLTIRAEHEFDWYRFADLAERAGALAMTYPALSFAEQLVPGTVSREVLRLSEREVPQRVRGVIGRLAPRNAQRVVRCSLEERFMWSPSLFRRLIQVVRELCPPGFPLTALPGIYRARAWRLIHGTVTR